MQKRLLFVEDDPVVRENYSELLEDEGFAVQAFADQSGALASAANALPDVALLDISLNHERDAGFRLCTELRRLSRRLPIMFFSSHDSEFDKISGIRMGADDYITKDVSLDYLVVRIEALLRRYDELRQSLETPPAAPTAPWAGPLELDMEALTARWRGEKVELSVIQLRMIAELSVRPGQPKSFSKLMRAAGICVEQNTVTAHIRAIRKAFCAVDPQFDRIRNERGLGYRWLAD